MALRARWSLRNIYLYLVCLITLIMVIVALVGLVRNGVELVYPDPGAYWERPIAVDGEEPQMDEEALEEERQRQIDSERRWTLIDLVGNAAMLLVAGPIYLYHWRKIETEPEEGERQAEEV
jgi:hypothetical protein